MRVGRWGQFHRCSRAGTVTEGGLHYCKTHAPSLKKARQDASYEAFSDRMKAERAERQRTTDLTEATAKVVAAAEALTAICGGNGTSALIGEASEALSVLYWAVEARRKRLLKGA